MQGICHIQIQPVLVGQSKALLKMSLKNKRGGGLGIQYKINSPTNKPWYRFETAPNIHRNNSTLSD